MSGNNAFTRAQLKTPKAAAIAGIVFSALLVAILWFASAFRYVLACILLVGSYYISWSSQFLPVWVFLVSIYILIDNLGRHQKAD